jgi:hypothetical protein
VAAVARHLRTRFESFGVFAVKVGNWDSGVFCAGGAFTLEAAGRFGAFGLVQVFGIAAGLVHREAAFVFAWFVSTFAIGGTAPLRRLGEASGSRCMAGNGPRLAAWADGVTFPFTRGLARRAA